MHLSHHIQHSLKFMHRSQIQHTDCTQGAIFGGSGGSAFHEQPDNCGGIVKRIKIRYVPQSVIVSIQMVYQFANGDEYIGGIYGGTGGTLATFNVDVAGGERIVGVVGRYGQFIYRLTFFTSKGRVFGPHGLCAGEAFHLGDCNVRGILGRYGSLLDSIGFYCTPP